MAKSSTTKSNATRRKTEIPQSQFPEPRRTLSLIGQDAALDVAARAIRGARPPQAWLISGPPGVGKATLAYRIARYLLAHGAKDSGPADLSVPANDPVSLQVAAGAHPGLLLLQRGINPDTGKLMTVLSVGEIRKLAGFFGMTSGAGGWRVAIVDSADDMNDNAANALLKLLEEPPSRAMLLVLSSTPGRLLPTIRSRCQRLVLRPLDDGILAEALKQYHPEMNEEGRARLARLSGGSLGAALRLAGGEGEALAAEAERLVDNAAQPDLVALMGLGDRLYRISDGLEKFGSFLAEALAARIRARAEAGAPGLNAWTSVLARVKDGFARADGLNLEPRQTILTAARDLSPRFAPGRRHLMPPKPILVDSHCHLDFPDYAGTVDAVMDRARAAGVGVCLSIGTELKRFAGVRAVAEKFPDVWCSVGVHPHEAEKERLSDAAPLLAEVDHPKVAGIGETGLDYYYEHAPRAAQGQNFRAHIAAGRQAKLPVIVHSRDADDDTIAVLEDEMGKGAFTGLIHCFTGSQKLADAALALGFYVSVSGIATFKNSGPLREVIRTVPLDRLLVETDAPFLAPAPHRGKTNEPAFVVHTARMLAELKGVSEEELAGATSANFFRLFTKIKRPDA